MILPAVILTLLNLFLAFAMPMKLIWFKRLCLLSAMIGIVVLRGEFFAK